MAENATTALATGGEIDGALKPTSLAEELAATRKKLSEERKPKLFELPGYGPKLQVKYKVAEFDEVVEILEKIQEQVRSEQIDSTPSAKRVAELSDLLVSTCVGFYTEVDGKPVPLEEAEGLEGGPIRWGDDRLVTLLGIEPQPGETLRVRAIIREVLGGKKALVTEHGTEVENWMERARKQVDSDF